MGVFQTSNHYIFKPPVRRTLEPVENFGGLECSMRKGRPSPSICKALFNSESEQLLLRHWVNVDVGASQDGSISLNLME